MQTLRFMPDYGGSALWYVGGPDDQCEWNEPPFLSRQLNADVIGWLTEWSGFHDCNVQDDTHIAWTERGRELCERIRVELLPHGLLVVPDFEGSPKDSPFR